MSNLNNLSNVALEDSVLALLCFSVERAPIVALRVHDATLFTNPTNQKIAETALAYIQKYFTAPGAQLLLLLENDILRGEQGRLIDQSLKKLSKDVDGLQADFIIEQLDHFLEVQRLQKALQTSMELLDQGDLNEAKNTLYQQVSMPPMGTSGILLNDPRQALRFFDYDEESEFFTSGIDTFDRRGVRPERKTLTFMIAAAGKGKSWWLINVGKGGWQFHKKVLHITLEMSEEKTARRYIQSIFGLTKTEAQQIEVPHFERNEAGHVTSIDIHQFQRDSVVAKRKDIWNKLSAMRSYPKLMIKEFPTSTLSTEHLSLYLDTLKRDNGFEPDEIIIDYADLMQLDTDSLRIDTGRLYRELRGIGVCRNAAIVSASQGNRESEEAKLVGSKNVAEDWSKIGTADNVFTYSQTPEERKLGLARIFAAKARDAEDKFIALISQAYPIGQFALDSVAMHPQVLEAINQIGG